MKDKLASSPGAWKCTLNPVLGVPTWSMEGHLESSVRNLPEAWKGTLNPVLGTYLEHGRER